MPCPNKVVYSAPYTSSGMRLDMLHTTLAHAVFKAQQGESAAGNLPNT